MGRLNLTTVKQSPQITSGHQVTTANDLASGAKN